MTKRDAAKEFRETMDEYEAWVKKDFELSEGWDDEVFYIMTVRDELHELAKELQLQSVPFDVERLKAVDTRWQKWLVGHTQQGYKMILKREDEPSAHWWWWVDKLSELSEIDKMTL